MKDRFWAVVPAAGVGTRMASDRPKQYLEVLGKPVLQHTLERLLAVPDISAIAVALGPLDGYWEELPFDNHPRILRAEGGQERADSVLMGLDHLSKLAAPMDWALVHDAARLCITQSDILKLMKTLSDDPVGGLLALPVSDTLKRVEAGRVQETTDRRQIWRAQTPQMFRYEALRTALREGLFEGALITDEASAIEWTGLKPRIIEGRPDNIKITRPEDLGLAAFFLEEQMKENAPNLTQGPSV